MTTTWNVAARNNAMRHQLNVSKGDAEAVRVDFTPWQEDNATITSATWTLESGSAAISGQALVAGVASALLTFSQAGRSIISILATTATAKKKVWLEVYARDQQLAADDYGAGL